MPASTGSPIKTEVKKIDGLSIRYAESEPRDVSAILLSPQALRMNAICERLAGTLRRELLDRSLILGEAHLRAVLAEYQEHYNTARPHQGIGQRIPDSAHHPPRLIAGDFRIRQIRRKPVLSGLINEYERAA